LRARDACLLHRACSRLGKLSFRGPRTHEQGEKWLSWPSAAVKISLGPTEPKDTPSLLYWEKKSTTFLTLAVFSSWLRCPDSGSLVRVGYCSNFCFFSAKNYLKIV
jgi:hypothetical protein